MLLLKRFKMAESTLITFDTTEKTLNIISYFKCGLLFYNIKYVLDEYQKNKFQLKIYIDEEGSYPYTEEYYFDTIYKIVKGYDVEDRCYFMSVQFATFVSNAPKKTSAYSYKRFSTKKDWESVYNFLVSNVIKKNNVEAEAEVISEVVTEAKVMSVEEITTEAESIPIAEIVA